MTRNQVLSERARLVLDDILLERIEPDRRAIGLHASQLFAMTEAEERELVALVLRRLPIAGGAVSSPGSPEAGRTIGI